MKIKCDFCGAMVDETEKSCPNCGAPLSGVNRTAPGQPKTIEELKQWYVDHNLPPEDVTRFFIGKNYKEPKAFGIYKDDAGDYVVYKNKADGSRAVRYRGSDEEYAVNELYLRLKEEILNQKERNVERRAGNVKSGSSSADIGKGFGKGIMKTLVIMMATYIGLGLFAMGLVFVFSIISPSDKTDPKPSEGYYSYEGNDYYKQGNDWYYYDASGNDWGHTVEEKIPEAVSGDIDGQYKIMRVWLSRTASGIMSLQRKQIIAIAMTETMMMTETTGMIHGIPTLTGIQMIPGTATTQTGIRTGDNNGRKNIDC